MTQPTNGSPGAMTLSDRNRLVEHLVAEHRDALTRYFFRRTSDLAEAEDMTNEIFFRLIRRINREPVENPQAFLFHSAANLLNDRHRRAEVRQIFAADSSHDKNHSIEVLSPERVLEGKQSLESVLKALSSVDARSRDIFLRHRVEGMKYAEIAQRYEVSVSTVEKCIMKCLVEIAKHCQGGARQ